MTNFMKNFYIPFLGLVCILLLLSACSGEKNEWKDAITQNTIQAYEDFLQAHPDGEFAAGAKAKIESIYLDQAKKTNTISAYREFLQRYPDGKLAEEAQSHIEKIYPSFSADTPLKIDSVPEATWGGNVLFEKIDDEGFVHFSLTGTMKVKGSGKEIPIFCCQQIELAPELRLSTDIFNKKDMKAITTTKKSNIKQHLKIEKVTVNGKTYNTIKQPYEVDRIEYDPVHGKVKLEQEGVEFIISGPNGAKLKKEGNGFLLVEGEAKLFNKKYE